MFPSRTKPEIQNIHASCVAAGSGGVLILGNSGQGKSDLALRLIRTATGRQDVVCVEHGYHGHTQALIDGTNAAVTECYAAALKSDIWTPFWREWGTMPA